MSADRVFDSGPLITLDQRLSENFPNPNPRYRVRGLLSEVMDKIGIRNVEGMLLEVHRRLGVDSKSRDFDAPSSYPTKEQFKLDLEQSVESDQEPSFPAEDFPALTDVVRHGRTDWRSLTEDGVLPIDYIYLLGKYMANRRAYEDLFSSGSPLLPSGSYDEITIENNWTVRNGVFRTLALKGLGEQFINDQGMDKWIVVRLEH